MKIVTKEALTFTGRLTWEKITNSETQNENVEVVSKQKLKENEIYKAKETELQKLHFFNTYQEVDDHGQAVTSIKWVIIEKNHEIKARLVAHGFEEEFSLRRDIPRVRKRAWHENISYYCCE